VVEEVGRIGEQVTVGGGGGGGGMGIRGAGGGGGRGEEEEGGGAHLETPRGSGRRAHGERPERGGGEVVDCTGIFICFGAARARWMSGWAAECRLPRQLGGEWWWE
jgi:hypothetical protein